MEGLLRNVREASTTKNNLIKDFLKNFSDGTCAPYRRVMRSDENATRGSQSQTAVMKEG